MSCDNRWLILAFLWHCIYGFYFCLHISFKCVCYFLVFWSFFVITCEFYFGDNPTEKLGSHKIQFLLRRYDTFLKVLTTLFLRFSTKPSSKDKNQPNSAKFSPIHPNFIFRQILPQIEYVSLGIPHFCDWKSGRFGTTNLTKKMWFICYSEYQPTAGLVNRYNDVTITFASNTTKQEKTRSRTTLQQLG